MAFKPKKPREQGKFDWHNILKILTEALGLLLAISKLVIVSSNNI
jgi:hypothetical protein